MPPSGTLIYHLRSGLFKIKIPNLSAYGVCLEGVAISITCMQINVKVDVCISPSGSRGAR